MIPFSSFMQAGSPIADMDAKLPAIGNNTKRETGESSGTDIESSFWDWVLKLTEGGDVTDVEGEICDAKQHAGDLPEPSDWGQLIALIAHARNNPAVEADSLPSLPANGKESLAEIFHKLETIGPEGSGKEVPIAGSMPQSLPAFLKKMGIEEVPIPGSGASQGKVNVPAQSEGALPFPDNSAHDAENKPSIIIQVSEGRLPEGEPGAAQNRNLGREWPLPTEPASAVDESSKGEAQNAAVMPKSSLAGKGDAVDADVIPKGPLTGKGDAVDADLVVEEFAPAKKNLSQANGQTEQAGIGGSRQMRFDENGRSRFRENIRDHQLKPNETVDVNEKKETERPILDPAKNAGSDPNRFSESYQAATKAPLTGKTNPTSAPVMNRMEAPVARAFQTTVMDQIVEKISLRSFPGRNEMQIRLKPDFLGNVQMHIAAEKDQLVVRMVTDQTVVKEIVESNLHHLKTELQNHGLTIDRFDILVNPDAEQHSNRDQFTQMFKHAPSQDDERRDRRQGSDADTHEHGSRSRTNDNQPDEGGISYFA